MISHALDGADAAAADPCFCKATGDGGMVRSERAVSEIWQVRGKMGTRGSGRWLASWLFVVLRYVANMSETRDEQSGPSC